jgi:hypothetical protein
VIELVDWGSMGRFARELDLVEKFDGGEEVNWNGQKICVYVPCELNDKRRNHYKGKRQTAP